MALQVYSTLSRTKTVFETIEPGIVSIYVCGVTVYDRAHVGHAMSYLVFDTVRRYLEHSGYRVRHVQNFTDIDDKTIRRAAEEGVSVYEIADRYAREFSIDMDRLRILPAHVYPRVSSDMPAIIEIISELIEREQAYVTPEGDVYFDVESFPDYGKLSGRDLATAEPQEGGVSTKRGAHDFALWKSAKPGEPTWEAPWGAGRPGWHIECSAMARHHLGEQIDIHGGGSDLIFPHHENEIAQTESACGCAPFAHYWLHNGLVQFEGEKMSKSLGNIVSIGEFLDQHEADALRLFVHGSHYRRPNTLSDESIAAAERGLLRLRGGMRPAHGGADEDSGSSSDVASDIAKHTADSSSDGGVGDTGATSRLVDATDAAHSRFTAEMDDDFGTPGAVAALFDFVTEINRAREEGVAAGPFDAARTTLAELAGVLGYDLTGGGGASESGGGANAAPFVDLLVSLRDEARANKEWERSDRLRDALAELGVTIEDRSSGAVWRLR